MEKWIIYPQYITPKREKQYQTALSTLYPHASSHCLEKSVNKKFCTIPEIPKQYTLKKDTGQEE